MDSLTIEKVYSLDDLIPKDPIRHLFHFGAIPGEPTKAFCGAIGVPLGIEFKGQAVSNVCKKCLEVDRGPA